MKKLSYLFLITLSVFAISCKCSSGQCKAKCKANMETAELTIDSTTTDHQKTSYGFGTIMAADIVKNGFDSIDVEYFAKGLKDALNKDSLLLTAEESTQLFQVFAKSIQEKKQAEAQKNQAGASAEGTAFLAANKSKEGVITTASGLQYKILKEGTGNFPKPTDKVKVHYEGKLLNGQIFDSSFERGQPIDFGLNQVIPGWTEGMQHINEGGEIELYVPYNLAYGERGAGASIPPFATLIFRVQLIAITPGEAHGPHDGHNH
ncbi:MAG: FKBP-type peptidyl-prolyl cis-trans isomerase FklB [Saprospiraceae bacterium]|jgi:FKBP-type peptidyl-prolyl cis-trans isomerase FklB